MSQPITFSIIVPIYKVEKHLEKCLDSIMAQTYTDFEVLAVNDGSPDRSQEILDAFASRHPDRVQAYKKENGGLSDARNYGIERAKGDYLLFVDSDDYLPHGLLSVLKEEIDRNAPDVIGFSVMQTDSEGNVTSTMQKPVLQNVDGQQAIRALVESKECFEPAWGYAYRRDYWEDMHFRFPYGLYHEDYALIPHVVLCARKVSVLPYCGYFYVHNDQGITKALNPEKTKKMARDLLAGYDLLCDALKTVPEPDPYCIALYLHYIASSLIYRLEILENGDFKESFRRELRTRNVISHVMHDTCKRKIRQCLIKIKNRL